MSARSWWRDVVAALAGRWEDVTTGTERDETEWLLLARIAELGEQLAAERKRSAELELERDAWRRRARCAPLTAIDEEHERAVRHADAEQTGGR